MQGIVAWRSMVPVNSSNKSITVTLSKRHMDEAIGPKTFFVCVRALVQFWQSINTQRINRRMIAVEYGIWIVQKAIFPWILLERETLNRLLWPRHRSVSACVAASA